MSHLTFRVGTFLVLLFSTVLVLGQKPDPQIKRKIDSLLAGYAVPNGPGYSMAVIKKGKIWYERYEGFADLENNQLATRFTNYRLASVTKQFTALAILQLVEAKKLSLDDNIQHYLPTLPTYATPIRIRDLLNHVSGLVDYENFTEGYREPVADADVLKILSKQDTLRFVPGSKYDYSNSGYSLLASIIEKVSGKRYPDYIKEQIFEPLKMDNSAFNIRDSEIKNRAYGYSKINGAFQKTDQSSTSYVLGDGGIYSSVNDLIKWQNALMKGKLLKGGPLEQATQHSYRIDKNTEYACGWRIKTMNGQRVYNHTGGSRGFLAYHLLIPDKNLGLIILTNRTGTPFDPGKIGDQIIELLLK